MKLRLEQVTEVPLPLEPGVLYYSAQYDVAVHLCPCGCGLQTVTPTGGAGWAVTIAEDGLTLSPSLLNPCNAHYFIRSNQVVWT